MTSQKIHALNERIKSHPSWKAYQRDNREGNEAARMRVRAQTDQMEVKVGSNLKFVSPVCETAKRWALSGDTTLQDHGVQTLAYWGVEL